MAVLHRKPLAATVIPFDTIHPAPHCSSDQNGLGSRHSVTNLLSTFFVEPHFFKVFSVKRIGTLLKLRLVRVPSLGLNFKQFYAILAINFSARKWFWCGLTHESIAVSLVIIPALKIISNALLFGKLLANFPNNNVQAFSLTFPSQPNFHLLLNLSKYLVFIKSPPKCSFGSIMSLIHAFQWIHPTHFGVKVNRSKYLY